LISTANHTLYPIDAATLPPRSQCDFREEQAEDIVIEVHPVEVFRVVGLIRTHGEFTGGIAMTDVLGNHSGFSQYRALIFNHRRRRSWMKRQIFIWRQARFSAVVPFQSIRKVQLLH